MNTIARQIVDTFATAQPVSIQGLPKEDRYGIFFRAAELTGDPTILSGEDALANQIIRSRLETESAKMGLSEQSDWNRYQRIWGKTKEEVRSQGLGKVLGTLVDEKPDELFGIISGAVHFLDEARKSKPSQPEMDPGNAMQDVLYECAPKLGLPPGKVIYVSGNFTKFGAIVNPESIFICDGTIEPTSKEGARMPAGRVTFLTNDADEIVACVLGAFAKIQNVELGPFAYYLATSRKM